MAFSPSVPDTRLLNTAVFDGLFLRTLGTISRTPVGRGSIHKLGRRYKEQTYEQYQTSIRKPATTAVLQNVRNGTPESAATPSVFAFTHSWQFGGGVLEHWVVLFAVCP